MIWSDHVRHLVQWINVRTPWNQHFTFGANLVRDTVFCVAETATYRRAIASRDKLCNGKVTRIYKDI